MTKATKMELVSKEDTKQHKVERMKYIRARVAKALKNNQRIDQMQFDEDDTYRVLIALQDEVSNARQRHQKATSHIATLKNTIDDNMPVIINELNQLAMESMTGSMTVDLLQQRLDQERRQNDELTHQVMTSQAVIEALR